ncbi:hypothetical protein K449DRAFT_387226 [Hypoxylon sp. EC38]|nr:hypothetical protein K449DRAFT_387226 [Hypoxylon sp. EC38]
MPSTKRKSEDDPTVSTAAVISESTSKKRRRLSNDSADEVAPGAEKKIKKVKKVKKDKKEKKDKKSKKSSNKDKDRKRKSTAEEEDVAMTEPAAVEEAAPEANGNANDSPAAEAPATTVEVKEEVEKPSKKSKKDKKEKKKDKKKSSKPSADEQPTAQDEEPAATAAEAEEVDPSEQPNGKKAPRFIVFVGNLPYSATVAQITSHFSSVHPTSVRLLHNPQTKKSRGIAFVEFGRYDHMKACLKTLHHSTFTCPSANGKGIEERKINVELTAGGGGNTEHRKEKIKAKNAKLNEERARRAQEEIKAKAEKEREKLEKGAKNGGDAAKEEKTGGGMEDAIHPSRRKFHRA